MPNFQSKRIHYPAGGHEAAKRQETREIPRRYGLYPEIDENYEDSHPGAVFYGGRCYKNGNY